jgi:hypothetical protein
MHTAMELVSHLKRNILSAIMPACDEMSLVMDVGVFGAFTVVGLYGEMECSICVAYILTCLLGLYLVLFGLAIWSTYQEPSIVSSRMRILACLMYDHLSSYFHCYRHTSVQVLHCYRTHGRRNSQLLYMATTSGCNSSSAADEVLRYAYHREASVIELYSLRIDE